MELREQVADLLATPDERIGAKRVGIHMAEHRSGLHSCRETDACMCLNCLMREREWRVSHAILWSNCPLCRLDLMNGVPAGHDFPATF